MFCGIRNRPIAVGTGQPPTPNPSRAIMARNPEGLHRKYWLIISAQPILKYKFVVEPWPRQVLLDTRKLDRNSTGTRQELDRIALDSSTKLDSYSTDLDSYSTETRPRGPVCGKIRNDCGLRRAHRGPAPGVGAVRAGPSGGFSLAARACNNVNAKSRVDRAYTARFSISLSTRIHQYTHRFSRD